MDKHKKDDQAEKALERRRCCVRWWFPDGRDRRSGETEDDWVNRKYDEMIYEFEGGL